ncbi:MAG: hypothetical protein FGM14_12950 [Flavobacteriales bacterium]|nr:hypothetical protein [Flavobacteriales bacterium]
MEKLKVLIPTDFSVQADFAYIMVEKMSQKLDMEIHFLHVMNFPDTVSVDSEGSIATCGDIDATYVKVQHDIALKKFRHLKEQNGKHIHTHITFGNLNLSITEFAEKKHFDLIVMGTKGAHGFFEKLTGSETQIVVRKSKVPVLSLMCDRSDLHLKNVLLVHQFEDNHHQDLKLMKLILQVFEPELHLLQISKTGNDTEKIHGNMQAFAASHGLEKYHMHVIKDSDVENGVIHFNQMHDMDLVCIGTHGKGGFFHSSATEKLINHMFKPIISFHLN